MHTYIHTHIHTYIHAYVIWERFWLQNHFQGFEKRHLARLFRTMGTLWIALGILLDRSLKQMQGSFFYPMGTLCNALGVIFDWFLWTNTVLVTFYRIYKKKKRPRAATRRVTIRGVSHPRVWNDGKRIRRTTSGNNFKESGLRIGRRGTECSRFFLPVSPMLCI